MWELSIDTYYTIEWQLWPLHLWLLAKGLMGVVGIDIVGNDVTVALPLRHTSGKAQQRI